METEPKEEPEKLPEMVGKIPRELYDKAVKVLSGSKFSELESLITEFKQKQIDIKDFVDSERHNAIFAVCKQQNKSKMMALMIDQLCK